ncbi:hypothetical protein J3F83DRAFT_741265 [Trichoderma novae-zelandiae]
MDTIHYVSFAILVWLCPMLAFCHARHSLAADNNVGETRHHFPICSSWNQRNHAKTSIQHMDLLILVCFNLI